LYSNLKRPIEQFKMGTMIGRILFLSAAAFVSWRYIRRSNARVQEIQEAPGTVNILPPERTASTEPGAASEPGRAPRQTPKLSAAAEDLSRR